jgi:hypothetical protein
MFGADTLAAIDSLEINSAPPRSQTNRTDVTRHGVFRPTESDPLVCVPTRDLLAGPFDDVAIRSALESNEPVFSRAEKFPRKDGATSKGVSDLIKAYTSERAKFSGDYYEESLITIRRRFFTLCKMLNVHPLDACEAAYLPFTGTSLEYYYDSIQATAQDVVLFSIGCGTAFRLQMSRIVRLLNGSASHLRVSGQPSMRMNMIRSESSSRQVRRFTAPFLRHMRRTYIYVTSIGFRKNQRALSLACVSSSLPQSRDMKVISSESRRTQGASFSPRAQMSGSQMKPISIQRRT